MVQEIEVSGIAVIGMAGRFPGAETVGQYWDNLINGRETLTQFSQEELLSAGVPRVLAQKPEYCPVNGVCPNADMFDAALFGYSRRDAELIDPNQRIFLELAWEALETAGYNPVDCPGLVGVYGGQTVNTYAFDTVLRDAQLVREVGLEPILIGNDKDYLATRCSYKLGLKGPSVTVQTACSTALSAVHLACQALLLGDCDMAIAGGISVKFPQQTGYLPVDGGVMAHDGHCRAFDHEADGTVSGNGGGVVVLKPLAHALDDGDPVLAVILGSAINNDGHDKVSFTAPNVKAQASVIADALAISGISAETIGYIEAHGTGTALGDPIEIAGLTEAFGQHTDKVGFCRIGSVKTNIGHLDTAAGIAGLIKAILAVHHGMIPPTLNWRAPNPRIEFDRTPFRVNTSLSRWDNDGQPRRAGVSSFGFGGTNVHVVVEQAPARPAPMPQSGRTLMTVSGRSRSSLDGTCERLSNYLDTADPEKLGDIAYTLNVGRKEQPHRLAFSCQDLSEARDLLKADTRTVHQALTEPKVVFLFPGQGVQRGRMGAGLYNTEPAFREAFDECASVLVPLMDVDVRTVLFDPDEAAASTQPQWVTDTRFVQPSVFAFEYALAKLWMSWGVKPDAMIGHSLGEYVAAHFAGMVDLEAVLRLVVARGRLMDTVAPGKMLSVPLSEGDVRRLLSPDLSIAAVNGPNLTVVAGPGHSVDAFERALRAQDISGHWLVTARAFHSAMMNDIEADFVSIVEDVDLKAPSIPVVSNVTATWMDTASCDPAYWGRHLRSPVRYGESLRFLRQQYEPIIFIEIGPGQTLARLAQTDPDLIGECCRFVTSVPNPGGDEDRQIMSAVGDFWAHGGSVAWQAYHGTRARRRMALPTSVFDRQRYWVDGPKDRAGMATHRAGGDQAVSGHGPVQIRAWQRILDRNHRRATGTTPVARHALVVALDGRDLQPIVDVLKSRITRITAAVAGPGIRADDREGAYPMVDITSVSAVQAFFNQCVETGEQPDAVIVLATEGRAFSPDQSDEDHRCNVAAFFHGVVNMVKGVAAALQGAGLTMVVVGSGVFDVSGDEEINPYMGLLVGPTLVTPLEYPNIVCRLVDVWDGRLSSDAIGQAIIAGFVQREHTTLAVRGKSCWVPVFADPVGGDQAVDPGLRDEGTYLLIGGAGDIGAVVARRLIEKHRATVILVARSLSDTDVWQASNGEWSGTPEWVADLLERCRDGGSVVTVRGDATSAEDIRRVFAFARQQTGRIDGVFHLAGMIDAGVMDLKAAARMDQVLSPKVMGTINSYQAAHEADAGFLCLFSSLSTVVPTFAQCDYTAANAFQSAFARWAADVSPMPVMAIAWDAWSGTRMALGPHGRQHDHPFALSEEIASGALERILAQCQAPELLVSSRDLSQTVHSQQAAVLTTEEAGAWLTEESLDRAVLDIWRRILGQEDLTLEDDFVAVGGHSLAAMRIIAQVQQASGVKLPFREVFASMRSARDMAAYVKVQIGIASEDDQEVGELIDEILSLPEEDAWAVLNNLEKTVSQSQ